MNENRERFLSLVSSRKSNFADELEERVRRRREADELEYELTMKYTGKLRLLSNEDLDSLLLKIHMKQANSNVEYRNIEGAVVSFIERYGKDISYEYNINVHPDDASNGYFEVDAKLISTGNRYWVSAHIMGRSWFAPFEFNEMPLNLCRCNKCGKNMLHADSYRILDCNDTGNGNLDVEPTVYFYCREHYNQIKRKL